MNDDDVAIDWSALRSAALEAAEHAYAPYSNFKVGAAALTDDGRVVTGCNVENASYGLTLCAECGLVSNLINSGGRRIVAVSTVAQGAYVAPCGRCRQVLLEHGGPGLLVDGPTGSRRLDLLLPDAFGPEHLA
jgi:cytidine deaminase